jgi:hypothetical protein
MKNLYKQMNLPNIPEPQACPVNAPSHYTQTKIQPLDVIKDWSVGEDPLLFHYKSQILKYIRREKDKGQLQDLLKAQFFMNELVEAGRKLYEHAA